MQLRQKGLRKYMFYFIYGVLLIFLVQFIRDKYDRSYDDYINEISKKKLKSIQLLTGYFHYKNWSLGHSLGQEPFKNCPETRCYAFQTLLIQSPIEKSDGILVHGPNLWYMPNKSTYKRSNQQLWMFFSQEPQGLTHCSSHYKDTDLDNWFNLTATFKSDSDLVTDYKEFRNWSDIIHDIGYMQNFKKLFINNNDPVLTITDLSAKDSSKSSVIWFVSHCETFSRRELYVNELTKYINIDIYGSCGNYFNQKGARVLKDPCKNYIDNKDECIHKLFNSYKFYLSFENSLCNEYITEKFWKIYNSKNIFNFTIVPVVRGAKDIDYEKEAMPNSYISTTNFKEPKDLANYLTYLNSNKTAYLEYLNWKIKLYKEFSNNIMSEPVLKKSRQVSSSYALREPFCKLCSMLHNKQYLQNHNTNHRWILSKWFTKKSDCWDKEETRFYLDKITRFVGYCI